MDLGTILQIGQLCGMFITLVVVIIAVKYGIGAMTKAVDDLRSTLKELATDVRALSERVAVMEALQKRPFWDPPKA